MQSKFGRDLTTGSIPRHMLAFSIPMLLGSFLQTAYSFVNAIWVGQYLGTSALAAVTVSFPVIFVLFAVAMGLTLATNILVSQNYGAKRMDDLRRVIDSSTLLIFGSGIVLTILGEIFAYRILLAMDTPADLIPAASSYLRIYLASLPLAFGLFLMRSMLQGIGDSKTPLYFQFGSVILTAVLDPLLMLGWLGFPNLGLNGTAWASVIAQGLALISMIAYLRAKQTPVLPRWPRFGNLKPVVLRILRIGIPASVQQSLISIGMVFVTGIVNGYGEVATAAFGAASRIDQIAFMPAMTMGMAVSTLAGQNLGAGHYHRVKEVFWWGCLFSVVITLTISLAAMFLPDSLLRIFVSDAPVVELGASYLRIVGSCYLFFAVAFISNGIINGAGHTLMTTVFSLISLWIVRVPLAYWLSHRMGSVAGVWYAISASFVVSMLVSGSYYFSGSWRKAVVKKAAPQPDPAEVFGHETGEA